MVAAVAVSTGFAKLTDTQSFEESFSDFVPSTQNQDESELVAYDNDGPSVSVAAPYDFEGFGLKYLSLDTGDATLWRTNAGDAAYFDMVMQFNPSASAPTLDTETKIAVYLNSSSNLVVLAGPKDGDDPTEYVTSRTLNPGDWGRLTISVVNDAFQIRLNGAVVTYQEQNTFEPITGTAAIQSIGFKGSGKLDDFVARTTDPFYSGAYVASIGNGGEKYATLDAALADDPTATFTLNADATTTKVLANRGDTFSIALNGHGLSGLTAAGSLVPVASLSDGVTTYTADYFPRTATAGQDGSAANPYELANADDLTALKDAFTNVEAFRSKNYKLVANIDATSLGYWGGIGTQGTANSGLNGGTLDGAGYTISNLSFDNASNPKYRGFFNRADNATIKDLTINVAGFKDTDEVEHGYAAFVGNMKGTTLLRCAATGTLGTTAKPTKHTTAGLVVKVDSTSCAFVDCTNYVNIVCALFDNPKVGGIVGLVNGSSAALTNCWNFGRLTLTPAAVENVANGAGGLVGYSQGNVAIYGGGNEGIVEWTKTAAVTDSTTQTNDINVGTIIGMETGAGKAATATGGVVAQADKASVGAGVAQVTGLNFATVENNVATFTDTLVAGNTYKVMNAGVTATYEFAAAGTIAFDTAMETPTFNVTADTTTLVLATPVTEGTVTTYAATAGAASVDNFAYSTFAEAVAALEGATDDYVTLLDNVQQTYVLSSGDTSKTLTVKTNGFSVNVTKRDVDVLGYSSENGFDTYVSSRRVAYITKNDATINYASLQAAFEAAVDGDTVYLDADNVSVGVTLPLGVSFSTNGKTYSGTVTVANTNLYDINSETVEDATIYTVVGGTAVASITKDEVKTEYNTIAKAIAAAEANDTVVLEADSDENVLLPTGVSFVTTGHTYSGTVSAAAGNGYEVTENNGVYAIVDNTSSTWIGDEDDFWATASNWSTGLVPGQYTTVTFPNAGRIRFAEGNGSVNVGAMVVNANVTFSENNVNYSYYPFINVCGGSISGTGKMTLERCGLKGNGTTLTVGCQMVFAGDSATTHDCFLQNGPIVFNGTVSSTKGRLHLQTPVTFNGAVNLENATMTSIVGSGSAPTFNGAVTLGTGASILTYAVTYNDALTIGDGAVVSVGSNTQTYGDNFVLTGSGRFIGDTVDVKDKVKAAFRDPTAWTGTYEIKGRTIGSVWWLTDVGNANSKVCFNNVTTVLYNTSYSGSHAIGGMEIGAGGLTINGTYNKAGTWALPELSGTGTLTIGAVGNENKFITFPADCSDFAGGIAWTDAENINVRVVFGSTDREFTAKTIVVGVGAEVGAGTWTAVNGIFVDGDVSLASAASTFTGLEGGIVGSGKIIAANKPTTAPTFDATNWTGTFVADWSEVVAAGSKGPKFDINALGNEGSTVEVTGNIQGGHAITSNTDVKILPTLKVTGSLKLDNGYSGKTTTFRRVIGTGLLTFEDYSCKVETLDNFTGVLATALDTFDSTFTSISNIVLAATPNPGDIVLRTTAETVINGIANIEVNGSKELELEFLSDGSEGPGLYVVAPPSTVTIDIPTVANTTPSVTANGEPVEIVNGQITVADGAAIVLTYTSTTHEVTNGTIEFTAADGYTVDASGVTTAAYVAKIDGGSTYTSLQAAFDAAANGQKIVLLANEIAGVTLPSVAKMVYFYAGEFTHGEIADAEGQFVTTQTEEPIEIDAVEVTATKYRVEAAFMAVTISDTRTLYGLGSANDALAAANAGPLGTTVEFFSGDPASYAAYLPMFTYNEQTGIYTKTLEPVAAVYSGVQQLSVHTSLADAIAAAEDGLTVKLLADASMPSVEFGEKYGVNCAQGDSEIVINKAITLDGNGHTIYGLANYFTHEMADGCHDLFITGSKNVTIKNVTLADFGGSAYVSKFTYPIWAGQGYTGTLVLDNVTVTNFNRTAFNFNGGTVVVTNCTVVGDAPTPRNTNGAYFQNGIGVLNANVTVFDSTFSGIGAYDPDNADSNAAECFQLMGNGATSGTGSITVNGGSYSGQYVAIVADNATGTIALNGGDFVGTLDVEEGSTGSIAVSGGTFDRQVPAAYCASGKVPTTTADAQGKYTVVDYVPPSGIDPTSDAGAPIAVDTTKTPEQQAADAQAAAAAMDVQKTADATSVDQATWNGYFTKTAEKVNDVWVAKAELNPAVVLPVDGAEETPLTDMLESVAATAVDATGETKASVPTKAGLYYWIEGATEVGAASYTPGTAVLGNGGTLSLTRPTLTGENGKAFFKVCVGVAAPTQD